MEQLKAQLIDQSPDWKVTIENKKDKMTCEQRVADQGFNVCRVKTYSDYDALTTWRAFTNIENKYKYDPNVEKLEILE